MVNKCVVTNCTSGYATGLKKPSFLFPEDSELRKKWIYFVNRKDWFPTKYSVICIDHFEEKNLKRGKSRCKLIWELHPVPTIHPNTILQTSILRTPTVSRRSPRKRAYATDELETFLNQDKVLNFSSFASEYAPNNHSFKKLENSVQYYNLFFDETTGVPAVRECISIDRNLHVTLTYNGYVIPLPEWFRSGHNCTVTKFSMLENFASYVKQKGEEYSIILKELNDIQHYKPQGRPKYSSTMIRFSLLLRYSSCQTYKLLLEQLPLPSLSLMKKLTTGGIDAVKVAKLLLEKESVSSDCVLLIDEMYLQKSVQYHSGNFVGQDEEGNMYKGIVVFMIVSLKKSIPCVIRSCPETKISGEWLKNEINACVFNLMEAGFKVRAIVTDNHATNVNAFTLLHKMYNGDKKLFIYHPAYNGSMKTYLFFDIVHLIKNIRNNLLNRKKFVFPSFKFSSFRDDVEVPEGYISWRMLYELYEKDETLQGHLRKAPRITYQAIHPGNNKQNVSLALAIFDESTSAAIKSYFPDRLDAANILSCFHKLFVICNSKQRFNTANQLGNAAVSGDNKPDFLLSFADWVETWSACPAFTLTSQTSHALITTLRCTAYLITDLLNEDYEYVLTARFQSDPIERHFSKYRQMSGGRFLVSLREVNSSEKILALNSIIKEDINFWDENIYTGDRTNDVIVKLQDELEQLSTEIYECELNDDSKQVAVSIAGYIAKTLAKRTACTKCKEKLISDEKDINHDEYLKLLSRGGLTTPNPSLRDFVFQSFSVLDFTSGKIQEVTENINVRKVSESVLINFQSNDINFTCENHKEWGKKFSVRATVNIFFNNQQKIANAAVRKDNIKDFKKRQTRKE